MTPPLPEDRAPSPEPSATDISVCICTYRRPAQLRALLKALAAQDALEHLREIVVVDNDPDGSAAPVLKTWQPPRPVTLKALHCTTPNISLARNTALAAASSPWLALIDDDEIPVRGWLSHLLETATRHRADAVFGPVVPRYPDTIPSWVIRGRFFERRRLKTGARVTRQDVRAGNVLLRRDRVLPPHTAYPAAFDPAAGPFDPAFGRTGGEDTLLFYQLLRQGAAFYWSDEAEVSETLSPQRATLRWILMRAWRGGQSFMRVTALTTPARWPRLHIAWLALRAMAQLAVALLLTLGWLPFNRLRALHFLRLASAQAGKLSGALGRHHAEYEEAQP